MPFRIPQSPRPESNPALTRDSDRRKGNSRAHGLRSTRRPCSTGRVMWWLIGGTLSGTMQTASGSAQSSAMDGYVDTLLRSDNPSSQSQQNPPDAHAEMVRLFASGFRSGNDLSAADRGYVAKVVAARTGLSQPDAEKRANDVIAQVKSDMDKARKTAMKAAIWLTLSLFIGAFSAALAATEGGGLRDGTWSKNPFRASSSAR